jgi:hypothetical protein
MLQDFHFKIIHHECFKHANVDVLSRNSVDMYEADEDFDDIGFGKDHSRCFHIKISQGQ